MKRILFNVIAMMNPHTDTINPFYPILITVFSFALFFIQAYRVPGAPALAPLR